jgi:hypothetical protein
MQDQSQQQIRCGQELLPVLAAAQYEFAMWQMSSSIMPHRLAMRLSIINLACY